MRIGLVHWGIVTACLALATACPASDDAADGGGSEGDSESNGSTSTGAGMDDNSDSDSGDSTGGMGGTASDTGTGSGGTTGNGSTGGTDAGTDTGMDDTGDSSGTTGNGGASYPPCPGGAKECPEDYDACLPADFGGVGGGLPMFNWCSMNCEDADGCPAPSSGDATVVCRGGGNGGMGFCMLSCEDGATCPDGMECFMTPGPGGGSMLCAWSSM